MATEDGSNQEAGVSNEVVPVGVLVLLATLGVRKYLAYSRARAALEPGTQLVPHIHFDTTGWQVHDASPSASSRVAD